MARYVLSPQGSRGPARCATTSPRNDPPAARRVLNELREAMRVAEMPDLGHVRQDLAEETLRFWARALLPSSSTDPPIQFVRVLNAYRDVAELLVVR